MKKTIDLNDEPHLCKAFSYVFNIELFCYLFCDAVFLNKISIYLDFFIMSRGIHIFYFR